MATLKTKVELYLEANSKTWDDEKINLELRNKADGNGDFIETWNVTGVTKPIDSQIASYETAGNEREALNTILYKRKTEYPSLQEFAEAYCEKEIGGNSTKWDAYKIPYNKVRTDNPKE